MSRPDWDLPYPLGRRCCGALDATACHQRGLCWMEGIHPDSPGFRPAAPAAEADLRAEMARKLYTWVIGVAHENAWNCADALLNLPALRRLVEQAAALARVEALILHWETRDVRLSRRFAANELRRALAGEA